MVSPQSEEFVERQLREWLKKKGYITLRSPRVFIDVAGEFLEHKPDIFCMKEKRIFAIECKGLRGKRKFSNQDLYLMVGQALYYKEFLKCNVYLAIPYHGGEKGLPLNIKGLMKVLKSIDIGLIVVSSNSIKILLSPEEFML